jgi:hypothetical protein
LLERLALSDNANERNVAQAAAIPFGLIDYEFTRDMLFVVHELHQRDGDIDGATGWVSHLTDLLRETRPDLAVDLQQRFYELWPDCPVRIDHRGKAT